MTPEAKQKQQSERDAAICAYYTATKKLSLTAFHFKLGKQRILQILKAHGAWVPYAKTARTEFLGVTITKETKEALKEKALTAGISVSKLSSDVLDELVAEE